MALYKAFGWTPPTFAHLGLLTNDDGSKLSKRNASASVSNYQTEGYSPAAMKAWLSNLGSSFIDPSGKVPRTLDSLASEVSALILDMSPLHSANKDLLVVIRLYQRRHQA